MKAMFKQSNPCLNHKIHMLFEYGFYLKIWCLKTGLGLFAWCYAAEHAAWNEHFVYAFVDVNVVSGNDILDISILQADTISYKEIKRKEYDYFNVFPSFSLRF